MDKCFVCNSDYLSEAGETFCTRQCGDAKKYIEGLTVLVAGTMPSEDPRIFFFPMTFGELCDKYAVFCLRRSFTKSISSQQKLDYRIFKLKRSIETHLAQVSLQLRASISKSADLLFRLNAQIWRLRDRIQISGQPDDVIGRIYHEIHDANLNRLKKVRELDEMMGHISTVSLIYEGHATYPC